MRRWKKWRYTGTGFFYDGKCYAPTEAMAGEGLCPAQNICQYFTQDIISPDDAGFCACHSKQIPGTIRRDSLTEYVGREFQLMDHDVGRSIQIFAHSFPSEDIVNDAQQVLKNLVPIDREVTSMNGSCLYAENRSLPAPRRTASGALSSLLSTAWVRKNKNFSERLSAEPAAFFL